MKIENFNLNNSLGYLINFLSLTMKRSLDERLKDINVTVHQFGILLLISKRTNLTQKEIAAQTHGDEPSTARLMNRLQEKDFIKRVSDKKDKRKKLVSLTSKGEALLETLLPHAMNINTEFTSVLEEEERETLLRLLSKVSAPLRH